VFAAWWAPACAEFRVPFGMQSRRTRACNPHPSGGISPGAARSVGERPARPAVHDGPERALGFREQGSAAAADPFAQKTAHAGAHQAPQTRPPPGRRAGPAGANGGRAGFHADQPQQSGAPGGKVNVPESVRRNPAEKIVTVTVPLGTV